MAYKYKIGEEVRIKDNLSSDDFNVVKGYETGKNFQGKEYMIWDRITIGDENCYRLCIYDNMADFLWQEKALCRLAKISIEW